ncbi:hypothetical protein BEN30_05605 [Magnetovibrio blakemorei]|uniref:Peptidase S9 prolyl oligopeptidase catalytic domain-containing protein n=2 Tax=Magnetovibrio blakemorei TaxID=28181 RepID=A0A1E5QA80_9PROT|nr:hypothetical protein BEN30_05605 [Magnetovibrio blakemorei]
MGIGVFKDIFALSFALLLLTGCAMSLPKGPEGGCANEDFVTAVSAGKECLALKTTAGNSDYLVLYLHGDNIYKRPADRDFNKLMAKNSVGLNQAHKIAIARPGHNLTNGLASTGDSCTKTICVLQKNVDSIAIAINRLIQHYKPKHTTVIARSGGAGIIATILGKHPDVEINSALLLAGPYNQNQWLDTTYPDNKRQWLDPVYGVNNRSADEFIAGIRNDVAIYLVTGRNDTNVKTIVAQTYYDKLIKKGKNVVVIETDSTHFGFEEDDNFVKIVDQVSQGKSVLK